MIQGKHILLRAPEPGDLETIYRWENDPEVCLISLSGMPVSAFAVEQFILNASLDPLIQGQVRFMAERVHDHAVIGHTDLFEISAIHRRAGVGILLDKPYRQQGYGREMLNLLEDWSKKNLGLHQLWCTIARNNEASIKLFTKAGFEQTGVRKAWRWTGDGWIDEVMMQKKIC
ncbi:MAG: GNAT family protein [Bacteroidales bacterium]